MSEGMGFRDDITNFITNYGSTVIITERNPTKGNYGGYEAGSDNDGSSTTTKGIPSSYLKDSSGQTFGKLQDGNVVIVLKYSETIEKDYYLTWQSENYKIEEIKEIRLQDVLVAKRVKLSRKLD